MKVELIADDIMGEDDDYYALVDYIKCVTYTLKPSEYPLWASSPHIHSIYTEAFTLQLNKVPPFREIYNGIKYNYTK